MKKCEVAAVLNCFNCGTPLNGFHLFCDEACRETYRLEQVRLQEESARHIFIRPVDYPPRLCANPNCRMPFKPKRKDSYYCSRTCGTRVWGRNSYRRNHISMRILGNYECEACQQQFSPYRRGQRFCSQRCAQRIWARNFRQRIRKSPILLGAYRAMHREANRRHYNKFKQTPTLVAVIKSRA